jgi:transketolase
MTSKDKFPVDISGYKPLKFDLSKDSLTDKQKEQLKININIVRDIIVFFTGLAKAKGVGGHTGGAYDVVPEYLIVEAFSRGDDSVYPIIFDEAGHRVAIQYAMSALNGEYDDVEKGMEKLMHYREHKSGLPGHPEVALGTAKFDSGRLGHMWGEVNGIAMAHPDKKIVMLGSDGSFLEGNDAEAARIAVSRDLNVKVIFDDNNITIAGHPSDYMKGFSIENTVKGHGMNTYVVNHEKREDLSLLYSTICNVLSEVGPSAVINKRPMAIGIKGIEGKAKAHDAIAPAVAIEYFKERGNNDAIEMLKNAKSIVGKKPKCLGCSEDLGSCRKQFGKSVSEVLSKMKDDQVLDSVRVFDPDLEGSTGLQIIRESLEERGKDLAKTVYHNIGPQERGAFLATGGFGIEKGKQAIFATFGAFSEMIISELTMLRLRKDRNMLIHFSHSSEDDMSDNTCHFGWNMLLLDSGAPVDRNVKIYFPADADQMDKIVKGIYNNPGIKFVCSTRSEFPYILGKDNQHLFDGDYKFTGKDEVIREGKDGYVIAYGDMVYRALDAVENARKDGLDIGLINKPLVNIPDEDTMDKVSKVPFVLLVESQNYNTGVGIRFADWLSERDIKTNYKHMGATKPGIGGQEEQIPYQGLAPKDILDKIKEMAK